MESCQQYESQFPIFRRLSSNLGVTFRDVESRFICEFKSFDRKRLLELQQLKPKELDCLFIESAELIITADVGISILLDILLSAGRFENPFEVVNRLVLLIISGGKVPLCPLRQYELSRYCRYSKLLKVDVAKYLKKLDVQVSAKVDRLIESNLLKEKSIEIDSNCFLILLGHIPFSNKSSHFHLLVTHVKSLLCGDPNVKVFIALTDEEYFPSRMSKDLRFPRRNKINTTSLAMSEMNVRLESSEIERVEIFKASDVIGIDSNVLEKYRAIFTYITTCKPKAIFCIGGGGRAKFLSFLTNKFTGKVILLPFNIDCKVHRAIDLVVNHWSCQQVFRDVKTIHIPWVAVPQEYKQGHDFDESCNYFKMTDKVIVSALSRDILGELINSWKVNESISEKPTILDRFLSLIEAENVKWLVVGRVKVDSIAEIDIRLKKLIIDNKIIFLPFHQNLRAIFRKCDIYFHPFGFTGGGNTALMAGAEMLPIITLSNTDPAAYFNNVIFPGTAEDGLSLLESLVVNESLSTIKGREAYDSIAINTYTNIGKKLLLITNKTQIKAI